MAEDAGQPILPAFITSPVRVPVAEEPQVESTMNGGLGGNEPQAEAGEAGGYHLRPRRRRRPRSDADMAGGSDAQQTGDVPVGE